MRALLILLLVLMCLFLAAVFLTLPGLRKHPALTVLKHYGLIAHRGLHDGKNGIPENSLPAFRAAAEKGYPIENDIHLTKDGKVVVFHDETFLRTCGVDRRPEDMTLAEIRALSLGNTGEKVPTLSECLDAIGGRVPLLIEFKSVSLKVGPLCRAAEKALSGYRGLYLIQSFQPAVLLWYRVRRPSVCRGQLAAAFRGEILIKRLIGDLAFNVFCRPDFISYDRVTERHPMRRLSAFYGAPQISWTYRSKEEIEEKKTAFDAFIFEGFLPD